MNGPRPPCVKAVTATTRAPWYASADRQTASARRARRGPKCPAGCRRRRRRPIPCEYRVDANTSFSGEQPEQPERGAIALEPMSIWRERAGQLIMSFRMAGLPRVKCARPRTAARFREARPHSQKHQGRARRQPNGRRARAPPWQQVLLPRRRRRGMKKAKLSATGRESR